MLRIIAAATLAAHVCLSSVSAADSSTPVFPDPLNNDAVVTVPQGAFYQYRLVLNGVQEKGLPKEGLPLIITTIGNQVVSTSVQHDKVRGDSWMQRDLMVASASETGFELSVSFDRWVGNDRQARTRQLKLAVARNGDVVSGTYSIFTATREHRHAPLTWPETTGKVSGTAWDEETLRGQNSVADDHSWNNYAGTTSRFAASDGGAEIDSELGNARMVWKSPYIGGTEIGSLRGMTIKLHRPAAEGGASPIIGDGRVFQFRVVPTADSPSDVRIDIWKGAIETGVFTPPDFDTGYHLKRHIFKQMDDLVAKKPGLLLQHQAKGPLFELQPISQGRRDMALFADEQIICMDASTGRVLWTTTVPMAGLNTPSHKTALTNHTGA